MKLGNLNLDGNLFSAPLAGFSNPIFRRMCRRYGASATVSEMVSAKGLSLENPKTLKYLDFSDEERPIGIQLFCSDPDSALRGMEIALKSNPDFIDFNMGCPVKKIIKQGSGGALMKEPDRAVLIMKTLAKNSPVPVTVKLRSGWSDDSINFIELSQRFQEIGVSGIFIHPRTVIQGFKGKADRVLVSNAMQYIEIPVIYSGDIISADEALKALKATGADGLMIGRAAIGNPFIFTRTRELMNSGDLSPKLNPEEQIDILLEFYKQLIEYYGEIRGMRLMRKFTVWYTKGLPGNGAIRKKIFQTEDYQQAISEINAYREQLSGLNE
ncbi:MAG: tRNA dihydrouridine synthase DusB [candidate division Zixibacteria bacterium]|nr:tRNA dihydrouridine synthase DusB [candidate division Zixibacteria bacterium]